MPWTLDQFLLAVQRLLRAVRIKAIHLFEEPRTLEQVATLASDWFVRWLGAHGRTLNT